MRKYVTRHQVRHEGKRLPIGSVVELSKQDAEDLGDAVMLQSPSSGEQQANVLAEERLLTEIRAREQAEARVESAKSALLEVQNHLEAETRAREQAEARAAAESKARIEADGLVEAAEKALLEVTARAEAAEKALADATVAADGKGGKGKTAPLV